ncbi:hypothetical protein PG984_001113 [Apiospora sp. TS-2023a]|uniref:Conidiation-specific protein 8 n=1 Tax=Apiospora saccharicola TaxID=335842 RepID=A0ABR1WHG2_9PEZI
MDRTTSGSEHPSAFSKRRSSGPGFEGLMATKRTNDPSSQARRNSLHDQKPQAGFFGQMWHK